jgi:hypothetical protein
MEEALKRASFVEVVKTVLYGFIGVRRKADHERARIQPVQLIVAAVVFLVLFIVAIRTIVHFVTS